MGNKDKDRGGVKSNIKLIKKKQEKKTFIGRGRYPKRFAIQMPVERIMAIVVQRLRQFLLGLITYSDIS